MQLTLCQNPSRLTYLFQLGGGNTMQYKAKTLTKGQLRAKKAKRKMASKSRKRN